MVTVKPSMLFGGGAKQHSVGIFQLLSRLILESFEYCFCCWWWWWWCWCCNLSLFLVLNLFVNFSPGPSMHRLAGINGILFRCGSRPSGDVFKFRQSISFISISG